MTPLKAEEPALSHWTSPELKNATLLNYYGRFYPYPRLFLKVFHSQWTRPKLAYFARLASKFLWLQICEYICFRES